MKNIMISQKNYILVLSGMTIINLTMFISWQVVKLETGVNFRFLYGQL